MEYEIQTFGMNSGTRTVTRDELPEAYAELKEVDSPSVSCGDISDDDCLIVSVGDDYSVVTLGVDDSFYWLQPSDDDEPVEVPMGGTDGMVPAGAIVPRALGLEVLLRADDIPGIRADYVWVDQ